MENSINRWYNVAAVHFRDEIATEACFIRALSHLPGLESKERDVVGGGLVVRKVKSRRPLKTGQSAVVAHTRWHLAATTPLSYLSASRYRPR